MNIDRGGVAMTAIREQLSSIWRPKAGFLLAPLGWVADRLSPALESESSLLGPLLDISQARMHLIALALAHLDGVVSAELGLLLLRGPAKTILDLSLGHRPPGLDRALTLRKFVRMRRERVFDAT
jgi:hypothetical protein